MCSPDTPEQRERLLVALLLRVRPAHRARVLDVMRALLPVAPRR